MQETDARRREEAYARSEEKKRGEEAGCGSVVKKQSQEADRRSTGKKLGSQAERPNGATKRMQRGKCNCIIFEALEESVTESFLKLRRKVQLNVLKVG